MKNKVLFLLMVVSILCHGDTYLQRGLAPRFGQVFNTQNSFEVGLQFRYQMLANDDALRFFSFPIGLFNGYLSTVKSWDQHYAFNMRMGASVALAGIGVGLNYHGFKMHEWNQHYLSPEISLTFLPLQVSYSYEFGLGRKDMLFKGHRLGLYFDISHWVLRFQKSSIQEH